MPGRGIPAETNLVSKLVMCRYENNAPNATPRENEVSLSCGFLFSRVCGENVHSRSEGAFVLAAKRGRLVLEKWLVKTIDPSWLYHAL